MQSRGGQKKSGKGCMLIISLIALSLSLFFGWRFLSHLKNKKDVQYNSRNIYVYNLTDGKEVFSLAEDERVYPASLTKLMTIIVSLENIDDLSQIAPVDVEYYSKMVDMNSSMAGFYGKETTTFRDLLYGTMLASGGECAGSLAVNVSGSVDEFVSLMNEKAKELNLENTQFKNPEGMDTEGQHSSAKDIAMLLKYSLENEDFRAIFTKRSYVSTQTLDHPEGLLINSTVLAKLDGFEQSKFQVEGGKSGTTQEAGLCWATLSRKGDKEYIVVVLGVPFTDIDHAGNGHVLDTLKILEDMD